MELGMIIRTSFTVSVKSVKSVITDRLFKNRDTLLKSGACSNESAMFDEY